MDVSTTSPGVLITADPAALARIRDPGTPAVIQTVAAPAGWQRELAEYVTGRRLVVPRTSLPGVTAGEFRRWATLACAALPTHLRGALVDDLVGLAELVAALGGVQRLLVRIFTEAPTHRCGFHVDTVPPGAPTAGAVRVYNGATTEYVDPHDITGMAAFYSYLSRRERLARTGTGDDELARVDAHPGFLRPGATIRQVPPDSVVCFRHIDASRHWSDHPVADAWVHRSPMAGDTRLVVNVSPAERRPRGRGGHG